MIFLHEICISVCKEYTITTLVLQFGTATKIEKKIQLELKTKRYA